jgi:hypothetical protein
MFTLIGELVVLAVVVWAAVKYMPQAWKDWIKAKFQKSAQ